MRNTFHGLALAGAATIAALGSTAALTDTAEAHGKFRHRPSFGVVIGGGYGYGPGLTRFNSGCGWMFAKWQDTGNPKWYSRWHVCKYGW